MRVLTLTTSTNNGGAAKVAVQLHQSISKLAEAALVSQDTILSTSPPIQRQFLFFYFAFKRKVARLLTIFDQLETKVYKSYSIFPSRIPRLVAQFNPDIVHLHWVQGEFLSIEDISKINKPIVWTLHDCWPLSASEHHQLDSTFHFLSSYQHLSPLSPSKITFLRKTSCWNRSNFHFIAPSQWMHEKISSSFMANSSHSSIIPNPLDLDTFKRSNRLQTRQKYGWLNEEKIILLGSLASPDDPIKGIDLAISIFSLLSQTDLTYKLVTVGSPPPRIANLANHTHLGLINDPHNMANLYSASDLVVVPSRIETHSQTAAESIACGTPVIAFDIAGNSSVIQHGVSGSLIPPFQCLDFCNEILHILGDDVPYPPHQVSSASKQWAASQIADLHIQLYNKILSS